MGQINALQIKLEREEALKQDYQDNCKRLESELEDMADEIETLSEQRESLTEQLREARKEDFELAPSPRSNQHGAGIEELDADSETAKAMATASAGMRTEDIWEGSAKFVALANRFGPFMSRQVEQGHVESCVVEFVFGDKLTALTGGMTEKAFKVNVHTQICHVLSLICSRLHLANSQAFEIATLRGFELSKDRSLASYGLGMLFNRWILKFNMAEAPVGTDPAADTEMVQSLLYDHLDRAWHQIARHEAQLAAQAAEATRVRWIALDETFRIQERFMGISKPGRRKQPLVR